MLKNDKYILYILYLWIVTTLQSLLLFGYTVLPDSKDFAFARDLALT